MEIIYWKIAMILCSAYFMLMVCIETIKFIHTVFTTWIPKKNDQQLLV